MALQRVGASGSLTDRTYEALKEAIVQRGLTPNEILSEERLAEELGVSRTPLRAALQKLVYEHLIRRLPGKGYMVASLSRTDMEQVFFMRMLLEPVAARLAAQHRSDKDLARLQQAVESQRAQIEGGDYLGFLQHDREFHLTVASASQNPYLKTVVATMQLHGHRFLVLDPSVHARAPFAIEEHVSLVEAIAARDAEAAGQRMAAHVQMTKTKLAEVLHDSPFTG